MRLAEAYYIDVAVGITYHGLLVIVGRPGSVAYCLRHILRSRGLAKQHPYFTMIIYPLHLLPIINRLPITSSSSLVFHRITSFHLRQASKPFFSL